MASWRSSPVARERAGEALLPAGAQGEDGDVAGLAGGGVADLPCQPAAHMLDDEDDVGAVCDGLADGFHDRGQVADRDPLGQQALQHALDAGRGDPRRHQLADQLLVLLRQLGEQLLRLGVGQHLGQVVTDELGQVGGHHGGRVDHRVALDHRLLAQARHHPHGAEPEGGLDRLLARQS